MVRSFIISIHALLAESDARQCYTDTTSVGFLSTLSLRRATAIGRWGTAWRDISIHALLAESDCQGNKFHSNRHGHFYPRSPCGERRPDTRQHDAECLFLSTLSLRRATILPPVDTSSVRISIHALLAESDGYFLDAMQIIIVISIHALLAESDASKQFEVVQIHNFYPRSPCGERLDKRCQFNGDNGNFYPRSPCGERLIGMFNRPHSQNFYPRSPCGERPGHCAQ